MNQERSKKKEHFDQTQKKGLNAKAVFLVALLVAALGIGGYLVSGDSAEAFTRVKSVDGKVRIDLDRIDDGKAHYFSYASSQGELNFFVVKSEDGVIRAAFDACDVCYHEKKGYRQEGNVMVCNNCNMRFHSNMINVLKGGCNPAPLNRAIVGDKLIIKDSDLVTGAWFFNS